jgi:hypothetical protein
MRIRRDTLSSSGSELYSDGHVSGWDCSGRRRLWGEKLVMRLSCL